MAEELMKIKTGFYCPNCYDGYAIYYGYKLECESCLYYESLEEW